MYCYVIYNNPRQLTTKPIKQQNYSYKGCFSNIPSTLCMLTHPKLPQWFGGWGKSLVLITFWKAKKIEALRITEAIPNGQTAMEKAHLWDPIGQQALRGAWSPPSHPTNQLSVLLHLIQMPTCFSWTAVWPSRIEWPYWDYIFLAFISVILCIFLPETPPGMRQPCMTWGERYSFSMPIKNSLPWFLCTYRV